MVSCRGLGLCVAVVSVLRAELRSPKVDRMTSEDEMLPSPILLRSIVQGFLATVNNI